MKEMLGGCCVCSDEMGWHDNPLIYCDGVGCEVAVHQGCYGIQEVPDGEWFCEKCRVSTSFDSRINGLNGKTPRCELCPMGYGALKRTENGGWSHVVCALYIPEARFGDVHTMDPVILSEIPAERFSKTCYLCTEDEPKKSRIGACMECHRPSCKRYFHVTCAQQKGLLCEETGISKTVKYCGFCEFHIKKGIADPSIKSVPACRIPLTRPTSETVVVEEPTPPSSNNSGHMLVDPISRPEINTVLGLNQPEDAHLVNNFSPPLTTSSRSSVALDSTPPLASKVEMKEMVNGTTNSSNSLNALMNMGQNHNRLEPMIPVHERNGHVDEEEKPPVNASFSVHTTTPSVSRSAVAVKRPRETVKMETTEKVKRPRTTNRKTNIKSESMADIQALLDAVGPVVSETVSDFQRERIAGRSEAERRANQAVMPSTSMGHDHHEHKLHIPGPLGHSSHTVGSSPSTSREGNLPATMEALLERQSNQGAQLLMGHAQFDVSQLLTCLHQLKQENSRLEEQLISLTRRREHLLALNFRLSVPLVSDNQPPQQPPARHPPQPALNSPHHSPLVLHQDELSQMRNLATNRVMSTGQRPPSRANMTPIQPTFVTPQTRPPVSTAPITSTPLPTPPTSQGLPTVSAPPSNSDLTNISPERLAASLGPMAALSANNFNLGQRAMPATDVLVMQMLLQQMQQASTATRGVFPPTGAGANLFNIGGLMQMNGPSTQNGNLSK